MERRTNIRNRFVRRVVVGVHDSQAGGKVGGKYAKGGRNNKRFGSERALMCGIMKQKGALSLFQQKSCGVFGICCPSHPKRKHTQTHCNHAGYAFNCLPLSDRGGSFGTQRSERGAPHTTYNR